MNQLFVFFILLHYVSGISTLIGGNFLYNVRIWNGTDFAVWMGGFSQGHGLGDQSGVNSIVNCGGKLWIVGDFSKANNGTVSFTFPIAVYDGVSVMEPTRNYPSSWHSSSSVNNNGFKAVCDEDSSVLYVATNSLSLVQVGKLDLNRNPLVWENVATPLNAVIHQLQIINSILYISGDFHYQVAKLVANSWVQVGNWSDNGWGPLDFAYHSGSFYFISSSAQQIIVLQESTQQWTALDLPGGGFLASLLFVDDVLVVGKRAVWQSDQGYVQAYVNGNWTNIGPSGNSYWPNESSVTLSFLRKQQMLFAGVALDGGTTNYNVLAGNFASLLLTQSWKPLGTQPRASYTYYPSVKCIAFY